MEFSGIIGKRIVERVYFLSKKKESFESMDVAVQTMLTLSDARAREKRETTTDEQIEATMNLLKKQPELYEKFRYFWKNFLESAQKIDEMLSHE